MQIKVAIAVTGLLFLASSQESCRRYTCDGAELLPGDVCMAYNETSKWFVLSPCNSTITTCPNPALWSDKRSVTCIEWATRKVFSSDTFEDYYDLDLLLSEGQACDMQGIMNICDYSSGFVCHCPNDNCTCTAGTLEGGNCTADTPPCIPGYVCSSNTCVKMFSLVAGESATDERACEGGGPLITSYFSKSCRETSKTIGGIPHQCTHDHDCQGSDNTYTKCICGLNDEELSYCALHFNDDPMEQYRYAYNNFIYKDSVFWYFIMSNYPYIQGAVPHCLRNVWREFGEYKRDLSSGKYMLLSVLLFALG